MLPPRVLLAASLLLAPVLGRALPGFSLPPADTLPVDEIQPGMEGEVWTVFQGDKIEPFKVRVTGVLRNGLGPSKDIIICQLTDPRVQSSGAVAGMSGSPLYIGGRLVGALSYQLQRFETVRYAGFTPIRDMLEVGSIAPAFNPLPLERKTRPDGYEIKPLQPVFSLSGVSPEVADAFRPQFAALGLEVTALGGSTTAAPASPDGGPVDGAPRPFHPGDAVAIALAAGDITVAATGTVSVVDGDRLLAFGHPMLNLGKVDLPMARADIVTILPSQLNSFKLSNTGALVGTITQDRLSGVYGEVGRLPPMIPVSIEVAGPAGLRTFNFSVIRHERLTPPITALGLTQAVAGSSAGTGAEGWRIDATMEFDGQPAIRRSRLNPGAQGLPQTINEFGGELMAWLNNPFEQVFPSRLRFHVEPLPANPNAALEQFQVQRDTLRVGDHLRVALVTRDHQGQPERTTVEIPVAASWAGRQLEVVLASGRQLDEWTGATLALQPGQVREFGELVTLVNNLRPNDGVFLAVTERRTVFTDQRSRTLDYPGSVERIARAADEARYDSRDAIVPLWEQRLLPGRLIPAAQRRPLTIHPD